MGTFFDARTRIAHFRFEAHARENRASDDNASTHQHRMNVSLERVSRVSSRLHACRPCDVKENTRTGVQRDDDDVPVTRAILFVVIEK